MHWKHHLISSVAGFMLLAPSLWGAELKTFAPGSLWISGEKPVFELTGADVRFPCSWKLLDWRGNAVASGELARPGIFSLDAPLCGYYLLRAGGLEQSFGVVGDPKAIPDRENQCYAMDAHMSGFFPDYGTGAEVMRRLGVSLVRDQLYWNQASPTAPLAQDGFSRCIDAENARVIGTIQVSAHMPGWVFDEGGRELPANLAYLYRRGADLAEFYRGRVRYWQFGNEFDAGSSGLAAWEYAAALKAFALGLRSVDPKAVVVLQGCARTPLTRFSRVGFLNEMHTYADIFAFHTYDSIQSYRFRVEKVRAELEKDTGGMPIWVTENGTRTLEGNAETPSSVPGHFQHSPAQEMLIAEFIPKAQMTLQQLGVSKSFFFLLFPHEENCGKKDFGLMRRDGSIKAGGVAYAAMVRALAGKRCLGSVDSIKGVKLLVFEEPNGAKTLAYWALSTAEDAPKQKGMLPFTLPALPGTYAGCDAMGVPMSVAAKAGIVKLEAEAMVRYLFGVKTNLAIENAAWPKGVVKRKTDQELGVVLQVRLSDDFRLENGVSADLRNGVKKGDAVLVVWNFSDRDVFGTLASTSKDTVEGIPAGEIQVPAQGRKVFPLKIRIDYQNGYRKTLVVDGNFNGLPVPRAALPFFNVESFLRAAREVPLAAEPARWQKNASGWQEIFAEGEAVVFQTRFADNTDAWAYPVYRLKPGTENPAGAYGVAFEMQVEPEKMTDAILMAGGAFLPISRVSDRKWQTVIVPFGAVKTEGFDEIKIGMNFRPNMKTGTFKIRRLRLLFESEPSGSVPKGKFQFLRHRK